MGILVDRYFHFILAVAAASLGIAYVAEFVAHLKPCPLCVYSRFPYLLIASVAIAGLSDSDEVNRRNYIFWIIVSLIGAIIIGTYHVGVERGIFEMSAFCKPAVQIADNSTVQDFLKMLDQQKPAMCNKPELVVLFLSMAEWNLLLNAILLTISIVAVKKSSIN